MTISINLHPENPIEVSKGNPFEYDSLKFENSVIRLAQILESISTPFTMGLFGEWGSGKTSFMKLLDAYLQKDSKFKTFWFDAWLYENEVSLIFPLLSKLSAELNEKNQIIENTKKIATSLLLVGSNLLLKGLTYGSVGINEAKESLEFAEKNFEEWVSNIEKFKNNFEKLVQELKQDKLALIVFVDDLDRCMPENVIRLIENIKHFFSVNGCLFVIGVDKDILSKGIEAKYGTKLISGEDYIEKIINFSFSIPQNKLKLDDFILENFKKFTTNSYPSISEEVKNFTEIISTIGIDNPRKVRKLILRYLYFLSLPDYKDYIREIVCKLIAYREYFQDAYIFKKQKEKVHFFPETRENLGTDAKSNFLSSYRQLTYVEIEDNSCRGFAEIATNDKYLKLKSFSGSVP